MNMPAPPALLDGQPSIDWANAALPDAWPDRLPWKRVNHPLRIARALQQGRVGRVLLPEGLPGAERLPRYLLQEFHNLPNGNYSRSITRGYARAFDALMLGSLRRARGAIAERLLGARRALDIGAGGGHLAAAMLRAGIREVCALEPSPYLLQEIARTHPQVHCVQGVIESSGLPSEHFDAAGACFVFHEIPPRYADAALAELRRILTPGAPLVIAEPSPEQWSATRSEIWRSHGWRGVYFRALARAVHEPYVHAWHRRDPARWLEAAGFRLEEDRNTMPWRLLAARRA